MTSHALAIGERIVGACALGAFVTLLFTVKFAWSASSMYVGAVISGLLGALAVVGGIVVKVARGSPKRTP